MISRKYFFCYSPYKLKQVFRSHMQKPFDLIVEMYLIKKSKREI